MADQNNNQNDSLDPEIADLFGLPPEEIEPKKTTTEKRVEPVEKIDLPEGNEFLQKVIENENEEATSILITNKQHFEEATSKDDKSLYREKLAASYWNFYRSIATKVVGEIPVEKRLALRFNLLDSNMITPNQLEMIQNIPLNTEHDSIFYLDEWLEKVGKGEIKESVVDETLVSKKKDSVAIKEKLEKKQGQRDAEVELTKKKVGLIELEEDRLVDLVKDAVHDKKTLYIGDDIKEEVVEPYSSVQKESLTNILDCCKSLAKLDKELKLSLKNITSLEEEITKLSEEADSGIDLEESNKILFEVNTVKQMIKMCVGRQGNHFPILLNQYFSDEINQVATKQNLIQVFEEVEKLDPSLFSRTYKGEEHRIFPYVIIVPSYGDSGICWDPIPKENRATGKGRIAIPLFSKNLKQAVLEALADIRWQVVKEKAQHHWMEEGLTGRYYEYYQAEKLKGDIKQFFIKDYILWITWESQGVQKLHKDVRAIFWRNMPFPQEVKDDLKNKGYYYRELYDKDKVREKSV